MGPTTDGSGPTGRAPGDDSSDGSNDADALGSLGAENQGWNAKRARLGRRTGPSGIRALQTFRGRRRRLASHENCRGLSRHGRLNLAYFSDGRKDRDECRSGTRTITSRLITAAERSGTIWNS